MTDFWDAALTPRDLPQTQVIDEFTKVETITRLDSWLFPQRTELLAWSAAQGLILIHQGGGGLAIVHALANSCASELLHTNPVDGEHASRSKADQTERKVQSDDADERQAKPDLQKTLDASVLWTAAERALFAVPESWSNSTQEGYDSSLGRPYPPVATTDQRFAIFSSPYGVAVLPLCEMAGWAVDPSPKPIPLVELGTQRTPEWLVAAPPVLLESRDHEGQFAVSLGLLFVRRGLAKSAGVTAARYYWKVIDLNGELINHQKLRETDLVEWKPLAIEGGFCQLVSIRSRQRSSAIGLVFATPRGMWVGALPYDKRHDSLRISPLNLTPGGNQSAASPGELMLNAEVERRNFLRWERILCRKQIDSVQTQQVVLWFADRAGSREGIYKAITFSWPEEGMSERDSTPTVSVVTVSPRAIMPVGLGQRNGSAQMFCLMDRGALYSHQVGEQLRSEHGAFLPAIEQISGIHLIDPLVICVSRTSPHGTDEREADEITVRSIRTLDLPPRKYGPFQLEGDPVYWNGHLFVCERRNQQIHVLRIAIVPQKSPVMNV